MRALKKLPAAVVTLLLLFIVIAFPRHTYAATPTTSVTDHVKVQ